MASALCRLPIQVADTCDMSDHRNFVAKSYVVMPAAVLYSFVEFGSLEQCKEPVQPKNM